MDAIRTLAAGCLLLLPALSAAAEDHVSDRQRTQLLARPAQVLLPQELHGHCGGLTVTIKTHIERLRDLQKKAQKEETGPSPTLFGNLIDKKAYLNERRRVEALNVVLEAHGCNLVNIEEELKTPGPVKNDKLPTGNKKKFSW
jgi:hypothetical protein